MKYFLAKAKQDLFMNNGEMCFKKDKTYLASGLIDDFNIENNELGYREHLINGFWTTHFELEEIDKETYNLIKNL